MSEEKNKPDKFRFGAPEFSGKLVSRPKEIPTIKCKICETPTRNVFNINFKAVPVCESCARAIFIQQAHYFVTEGKNNGR